MLNHCFFNGPIALHVFIPVSQPDALSTFSDSVQNFLVEEEYFDDSRTVQALMHIDADVTIKFPTSGRVTESLCVPNTVLTSGDIAAKIDGNTLLALHTTIPLWRSLEWGEDGDDVRALRHALNQLGAEIADEGRVDYALITAVAKKLAPEGSTAPELDSIPIDRIMWIPQPEITLISCPTLLSSVVEAEAAYATVAGALTGITLPDIPDDLLPGDRELRIAGTIIPMNVSESVTLSEPIEHIAALLDGKVKKSSTDAENVETQGVLTLSVPIPVSSVSPAALFGVEGELGCVISDGIDIPIRIVGSKLGKTYIISYAADVDIPTHLDLPVNQTRECRAP